MNAIQIRKKMWEEGWESDDEINGRGWEKEGYCICLKNHFYLTS